MLQVLCNRQAPSGECEHLFIIDDCTPLHLRLDLCKDAPAECLACSGQQSKHCCGLPVEGPCVHGQRLVDVYSMQGCGCNQRFLNLASAFGHPRAEIIAGTASPPSFSLTVEVSRPCIQGHYRAQQSCPDD